MQTPGLAGVGRARRRRTEPGLRLMWCLLDAPLLWVCWEEVRARGALSGAWEVAQGQRGAARPGLGEPTGLRGNLARALAGSQVRVAWAQLLFSSVSGPPCGIWAGIPQGCRARAPPEGLQRTRREQRVHRSVPQPPRHSGPVSNLTGQERAEGISQTELRAGPPPRSPRGLTSRTALAAQVCLRPWGEPAAIYGQGAKGVLYPPQPQAPGQRAEDLRLRPPPPMDHLDLLHLAPPEPLRSGLGGQSSIVAK